GAAAAWPQGQAAHAGSWPGVGAAPAALAPQGFTPPPFQLDARLASWAASRNVALGAADLRGLKVLEPWVFLPPVLAAGRELRGQIPPGTISFVELVRGDTVGRMTGEDRAVLSI